jgi:hypothetical protein
VNELGVAVVLATFVISALVLAVLAIGREVAR